MLGGLQDQCCKHRARVRDAGFQRPRPQKQQSPIVGAFFLDIQPDQSLEGCMAGRWGESP